MFAALTQRLQMSVADARNDLQRHGSTLRSPGVTDTSSPVRQAKPHPISPDRTSISPSGVASPRIGIRQNASVAPPSGSITQSSRLWSSPKQDDSTSNNSVDSVKKRFPGQPQSQRAGQQIPAQKRSGFVADVNPAQAQKQAGWQ